MDIKFLTQDNEVQKLYSKFGLVVPVGDLSTGKAPAVQPLSTESTQTSVTAKFNVMSGADITALSYTVNDGEAVSVTPTKGVITITLTDLDYNSGPYTIKLTATNETGSTNVTSTVALQHYTNWATPDEVLEGNKYIGEDGEQHVGEIETKDSTDLTVNERTVTVPAGYYAENTSASVSSDYIIPSGTLPITQNGEGIDVTNYAAVNVAVPSSGPSTGGGVITSAEYYYDTDNSMWLCDVVFSSIPPIDTDNHVYAMQLLSESYWSRGFGATAYGIMTPFDDWEITSMSPVTMTFAEILPPVDDQDQQLSSCNGYLLCYEDGYDNLKYKIPCTITKRV